MELYGLIGNPLSHSFSSAFFTEKFASEGIDARYLNFELPDIGDLMEMLAEYPDLRGFNVTIPYKEAVMPYLTDISAEARAIGAVNVVKITTDVSGAPLLHGYNTDAPAFARSIATILPDASSMLRALVLGTGGASKAVCFALRMLGIEPVLVSRNRRQGVITYADLTPEVMTDHLVIVNTTPLGMWPDTDRCPDIPYDLVTDRHVCMDLTYNPAVTLFMQKCIDRGASVKNGADMLRLQALLSWQIWHTD
ncbi:MAG: shikimate dehydrogenase [Muribaculaceae bacterium]|nr:shikimate dehydrogenase [Muribaculaceae bacterium]